MIEKQNEKMKLQMKTQMKNKWKIILNISNLWLDANHITYACNIKHDWRTHTHIHPHTRGISWLYKKSLVSFGSLKILPILKCHQKTHTFSPSKLLPPVPSFKVCCRVEDSTWLCRCNSATCASRSAMNVGSKHIPPYPSHGVGTWKWMESQATSRILPGWSCCQGALQLMNFQIMPHPLDASGCPTWSFSEPPFKAHVSGFPRGYIRFAQFLHAVPCLSKS